MSKLGYLRMLGYIVTLAMHLGNLVHVNMNMTEEALADKRVRFFAETRHRYFTCWNFILQMVYAVLGLSCEILLIKNSINKNYSLPKHLKSFRDTLFSAVIWPVTLLVFTVFWTLYLYDKNLIFPDFIEKVLTPVSNHIKHTAIVPVVLWEILLQPRYAPKSHLKNIICLVLYVIVYLSVMVYTYVERGHWLYPVFDKAYGTIYFPIVILIFALFLVVFYHLQWPIAYFVWGKENKKKEKQKKVR